MKSKNWTRRRRAIERFDASASQRTIRSITRLLGDVRIDVREAAAQALGRIGNPLALEPLVSALKDDHFVVREAAAVALGSIGDRRAVQPLAAALESKESRVVEAAVLALEQIGDADAVRPLVSALRSATLFTTISLGRLLIRALVKIGDPRATEPLVGLLRHADDDAREAAAEALASLGWEPACDTERALFAVARHQWDEAAQLGSAASDSLQRALRLSDEREVEAVIQALGRARNTASMRLLGSVVKSAKRRSEAHHARLSELRAEAEEAQRRKDSDAYFAAHRELRRAPGDFWSSPTHHNYMLAVSLLGETGDGRALAHLKHALFDEDRRVRLEAIKALGRIGDQQAVRTLLGLAGDPNVGEGILSALIRVLREKSQGVPDGLLVRIAALELAQNYLQPGGGDCIIKTPLDCSALRALAEQEMARRRLAG